MVIVIVLLYVLFRKERIRVRGRIVFKDIFKGFLKLRFVLVCFINMFVFFVRLEVFKGKDFVFKVKGIDVF